MNKNQAKGRAKQVAGKAQAKTGKVAGNKAQQVKGISKQVAGKAQQTLGAFGQALENIKKLYS